MTTQEELSHIAALVDRAQERALRAQVVAQAGNGADAPALSAYAREAKEASADALHRLMLAGATLPDLSPPREDLADLAALESVRPDAQALAQALRALLPLAERIDAARGRSLPEPVAGSAGLDLAEDLVQLLSRVELDLYGPGAALTGARE